MEPPPVVSQSNAGRVGSAPTETERSYGGVLGRYRSYLDLMNQTFGEKDLRESSGKMDGVVRFYYIAGTAFPLLVRCERTSEGATVIVVRAANATTDAGTWSPPWRAGLRVQRKLTRDEWHRLDDLAAALVNEADAGPHETGASGILDGARSDVEIARRGRYRFVERAGSTDGSMLSPLERQMLRWARESLGKDGEFLRAPSK